MFRPVTEVIEVETTSFTLESIFDTRDWFSTSMDGPCGSTNPTQSSCVSASSVRWRSLDLRFSNRVSVRQISASRLASLFSGSVLFIVRDGVVMSWSCSLRPSTMEPVSHDTELTDPAYDFLVEAFSCWTSSARVIFEEVPMTRDFPMFFNA
jgi:hypothetical protein